MNLIDKPAVKQAQRSETLQTGILHHQRQYNVQQTILAHHAALITDLKVQLKQTQALYNETRLTLKDLKKIRVEK